MSKIAQEDFEKSLARLESLAKGQLFHTPSDSQPGDWAGSAPQDEDSMDDDIQENGTDYNGVKKALSEKALRPAKLSKAEVAIIKGQDPYPHIKSKMEKSKPLTQAERWVLKGAGRQVFAQFLAKSGMENVGKKDGAAEENKTADKVPDGSVADKDDGKKLPEANKSMHGADCNCGDCSTKKSFGAAAAQQQNLSKAIDMSPLLAEMARAIDLSLQGQEARVVKSVQAALAPVFARVEGLEKSVASFKAEQSEFAKSAATAIAGIGQWVSGSAEAQLQQGGQPVGAPRSQLRSLPGGQGQGIQPVNKSFEGPGGLDFSEGALAKSQVVGVMEQMVKAGKLEPLHLIKFESTNQISPVVQQQVVAWANGSGR